MNDIVIITSSWRPEFLYLCLEALSKCPEIKTKDIWIIQDHKQTDSNFPDAIRDTEEVIRAFKKILPNITAMIRPVNTFYGNSYSTLSAYNKAYKTDAKYVYLIEDDLVVTPDFFSWHESVQTTNSPFCSIGSNLVKEDFPYRSVGVCWKRENLKSIIEHYVPEYYATDQSMCDYVWSKFPDSKYGYKFIEQDGLICRIMERDKKSSIWSEDSTKTYHIGLWGYHRSIGLKAMQEAGLIENPLLVRIDILKKLLRDSEWINKVADFQTDIQVLPQ